MPDNEFEEAYREALQNTKWFCGLPDPITESLEGYHLFDGGRVSLDEYVRSKYHSIPNKTWHHPEPGVAFSFDDWKAGRTQAAVIPPKGTRREDMAKWAVFLYDEPPVRLQDTFRDQGIQVVVKLASIELTPEEPQYRGDGDKIWLRDGMRNDHIVATSILCVSSANMAPYSILFSVEASLDDSDFYYDSGYLDELANIFELPEGNSLGSEFTEAARAVQRLGRVALPEGRLVVAPAVLRRFADEKPRLADPSQPGHLRMLVLHLVDPHYRVCSTRNVPPQQHAWWWAEATTAAAEAVGAGGPGSDGLQKPGQGLASLPRELADQIARETEYWPMGEEEALKFRKQREVEEDLCHEAVEFATPTYHFSWD